jgi:aminoglycoside 3-N-acetyltransferase
MSLVDALKQLGVNSGDELLVHSDISPMTDRDTNLKSVLDNVLESLTSSLGPDGTLVAPTFNYDFCGGQPYDHVRSKSQVGLFSEWVRTRPTAIRSFHPIFSFAGIGTGTNKLLTARSNSSFGQGSVFENMFDSNTKILFLDVSFEACTFVHFVEQRVGIEYRYLKTFTGEVTRDARTWTDSFDFFVRPLNQLVDTYFGRLETRLLESGDMNAVEFNGSKLLLTSANKIFATASAMIAESKYSLLRHPPSPMES